MNMMQLKAELERDEGRRSKPYRDTEGVLTIGVGWNLEANGLPQTVIDMLFNISLGNAIEDAKRLFPTFEELSPVRQRVLVNMAFNLGRDRLAQFVKMRAAVADRDWMRAADEMLDSKWAGQVGARAERLAEMMRAGA